MMGFCSWQTHEGFFGIRHFGIYDLYAAIDIMCFGLLLYWIRQQHRRTSHGYFSPENPVVFPVYLWLLVSNAAASLFQAVVITNGPSAAASVAWAWAVAFLYGSTYGAYHVVIEGTTCLLLSPGIGQRSMRRAVAVGLSYGLATTVATAFWIYSPGLAPATVLLGTASAGQFAVFYLWSGTNAALYLALWVAPQRGWWARRPAAVYWGRFFFLYRVTDLVAAVIAGQGVRRQRPPPPCSRSVMFCFQRGGVIKPTTRLILCL
jgi:hypothetical protein